MRRWLIVIGIVFLIVAMAFAALSILSGHGLQVRSFLRDLPNLTQNLVHGPAMVNANQNNFRNIVFLHHSVGHNLIEQGSVRDLFTAAGYQFWDHDYNDPGLSDPAGLHVDYNYAVPADNTDPDGLLTIFSQPAYSLPFNTLSSLLQHEVIIFKSCFPASNIASDEQLQQRKDWYLQMRAVMDQHPDRLFVVVTQPPLNPAETNLETAARARSFANWLKSDEFLKGHPNVVTFDLFDQLAERDTQSPEFNMLRQGYRAGTDSHPTQVANEAIGPQLVNFVISAIEQYRQTRSQE